MTDRTHRIVRDQPRRTAQLPRYPRPPRRASIRGLVFAPVIIIAGAIFLIGALFALMGIGICWLSEPLMQWLYGGESEEGAP